ATLLVNPFHVAVIVAVPAFSPVSVLKLGGGVVDVLMSSPETTAGEILTTVGLLTEKPKVAL
ncbi:hypothetical protein OFC38_34665, partial [Escherichia coli]|nr:hypothetical protein [Escherichia coli]